VFLKFVFLSLTLSYNCIMKQEVFGLGYRAKYDNLLRAGRSQQLSHGKANKNVSA
jgi:hypothetical protein